MTDDDKLSAQLWAIGSLVAVVIVGAGLLLALYLDDEGGVLAATVGLGSVAVALFVTLRTAKWWTARSD